MSDDKADDVPVDEAGAKKKGGKGRLIAIAVVAVGLLAGAGGVYWFTQKSSGGHAEEKQAEAPAEEAEGEGHGGSEGGKADPAASYIEVPPMMVNLRGGGAQAKFVKVRFIVVAADGKTDAVKARLPVILDALQPFLRELRPDDLNGSAAVFRIKEEMLRRCGAALGKGMVRDVLIQDLIQQ